MRLILKDQRNFIDPSDLLRPESSFTNKYLAKFRDYTIDANDPLKERVRQTYYLMHVNQTVEFVRHSHKKWLRFNTMKATVREALEKLNNLVDESDPDVDLPNIVHAFQAAERARAEYPQFDWLHLTALIHDLGKIMAFYDAPQWAVVGDTYPVGCAWSNNIVYRENSFQGNPDGADDRYNTKYGIYTPHCGIDNLLMAWGHDEYMYQVLKHNKTKLPEIACKIIRFHSFYPWHNSGDYEYLTAPHDEDTKKWVLLFNRYDLYTKSEKIPNIESLWPYYQTLIDKFLPGELEF